ncbi:hypothetical protein GA0061102_101120 [Rhizobium miluonense]|uniref:Uncharacterized protein n=1 Tax=Rhizobium miluonense TaxID=411945 RepID=A0A1C3VC24_9HYPH|nr:hypothetical protein GA0061102_101120 [Rhizobium miluonense]
MKCGGLRQLIVTENKQLRDDPKMKVSVLGATGYLLRSFF